MWSVRSKNVDTDLRSLVRCTSVLPSGGTGRSHGGRTTAKVVIRRAGPMEKVD